MPAAAAAFVLVILAAASGGACGGRKAAEPVPSPETRWQGSFSPVPAQGAEVIAEVNGEKIYAADVARQAAARGLDARAALAELIDAELLAQEARRRGLADDPEVAETRKRERVRRLLATAFEPTFDGPEDIPQELVDKVWDQLIVHSLYNHERYHRTAFLRIPLERSKATPETEAAARSAAEAVYSAAAAAHPATVEDFFALGKKVAAEHGQAASEGRFDTTRYRSSVEEFAAAAFSIDEHGEVAKPARTDWGWDVIYLDSVLPERRTSKQQAEPEIRAQLFAPDRENDLGRLILRFFAGGELQPPREQAFLRWSDALVAKAPVTRNDAPLAAIDVDAPVVAP